MIEDASIDPRLRGFLSTSAHYLGLTLPSRIPPACLPVGGRESRPPGSLSNT